MKFWRRLILRNRVKRGLSRNREDLFFFLKIDIEIESARTAVNRRGELSRTRAESARRATNPADSNRGEVRVHR